MDNYFLGNDKKVIDFLVLYTGLQQGYGRKGEGPEGVRVEG